MLEEIDQRVAQCRSFAFETTLSGRGYAVKIKGWQDLGYHVNLIFLSLSDADMAGARVAGRVVQGGHDIPEQVIRRRFRAGLKNMNELYKPIVDAWILYDNTESKLNLLDWGEK